MTLSSNPVYNLKAVLIETGIKPDVLRAWERRYGLPMPQRTAGGQRLYSEHDVEVIKWLIARQGDGLSISSAVEMWKQKSAGGQDPLAGPAQSAAQAVLSIRPANLTQSHLASTGLNELRADWLAACLNFNETVAEQVLNQAFALYPLETVCTQVLQRGMVEVGLMWYENRASVQQEHFASALAVRRVDALMMAAPAPIRPENIIVGCPAGEWHTFTPLLMALLIRRRGYNVLYLGANIPAAYFVETVQSVRANLVLLAAQQLNSAVSLQQSAALIAGQGGLVAFGGRIYSIHPELVERVSGYYLGNRMDGAVDVVERLLSTRPAPPQVVVPTAEYELALKNFSARRTQLEATLDQHLGSGPSGADYFKDAHKYMGDNVISALSLGNINYLDSEIDWLQVMMQGYHVSGDLLCTYLDVYAQAVNQHLAGQAQPLADWLEHQVNSRKLSA